MAGIIKAGQEKRWAGRQKETKGQGRNGKEAVDRWYSSISAWISPYKRLLVRKINGIRRFSCVGKRIAIYNWGGRLGWPIQIDLIGFCEERRGKSLSTGEREEERRKNELRENLGRHSSTLSRTVHASCPQRLGKTTTQPDRRESLLRQKRKEGG